MAKSNFGYFLTAHILTIPYIDKNSGTETNYTYDQVSSNEDIQSLVYAALKGKHISCAGLNISGSGGSFNVGSGGDVTMKNSDITITDEYGNILIISAAKPFTVYNSSSKKTAELQSSGNLSITGELATGFEGDARTVINGNGIQSYNSSGAADGIFANSTLNNEFGGIHQIALYNNGDAIFKVFTGTLGTTMSLDGSIFLICNGNTVTFAKTLMYDGAEVANKSDILGLQEQINKLKPSNTNPTI